MKIQDPENPTLYELTQISDSEAFKIYAAMYQKSTPDPLAAAQRRAAVAELEALRD